MLKSINAIIFDNQLTLDAVGNIVKNCKFDMSDFSKSEEKRVGFTRVSHPIQKHTIESVDGNYVVVRFMIGSKSVKASTVNFLAQDLHSKLLNNGNEDASLKDCKEQVRGSLIGKATPDYSSFLVIFDFKNQLMYSDKSGKSFDLLKDHISSQFEESPFGSKIESDMVMDETLHNWYLEPDTLPEGFTIGSSIDMDNIDGSKGGFKNAEVEGSESVKQFLNEGGMVTSLNLLYEDKLSFKINKKGDISAITPLAYTQSRIDDYMGAEGEPIAEVQTRLQITGMDFIDIISTFFNYSK
ncbi:Recombination-associated protein RdgC (modular protein) [Vibrio chagasii]|nr:Recombination-associated protein RdgC (modular protein) [Vibrio chagasii]